MKNALTKIFGTYILGVVTACLATLTLYLAFTEKGWPFYALLSFFATATALVCMIGKPIDLYSDENEMSSPPNSIHLGPLAREPVPFADTWIGSSEERQRLIRQLNEINQPDMSEERARAVVEAYRAAYPDTYTTVARQGYNAGEK